MKVRWFVPLLAIALAWAAVLLGSCTFVGDPKPDLRPMALLPLTPAQYAVLAARAEKVIVARIESIDEAPEYTPGCGVFLRLTHNCPPVVYRMKLRPESGKAVHVLFEIPWDGFLPLREGMVATFFLHKRVFVECVGRPPYQGCLGSTWLALNEPADVAAP